jgi:hypothetical protein
MCKFFGKNNSAILVDDQVRGQAMCVDQKTSSDHSSRVYRHMVLNLRKHASYGIDELLSLHLGDCELTSMLFDY